MPPGAGRRASTAPFLIASLVASAIVYAPVTGSFFFADDFCWLFDYVNHGLIASVVRPWGGHIHLGPKLLTDVVYAVAGMHPRPYFVLTLVHHLLNVGLLFATLRRFGVPGALAGLLATMWGTLPAHAGTLAWWAGYAIVVATTPALLALYLLAPWCARAERVPTRTAVGVGLAIAAAAVSHGVTAALALCFPVACFLLVPPARFGRTGKAAIVAGAWGGVALTGVLRLAVSGWLPDPLHGVLVTSALAPYARSVASMAGHLLGCGSAALVLGLWDVPARWPGAVAVAAALVTATVLALGCRRPALRRPVLGLVLATATMYLAVAAGRADLYVRIGVPLASAAAAGRYHYLEPLPLVLALGLGLSSWAVLERRTVASGLLAAWTVVMGAGFVQARPPILLYEDAKQATAAALDEILGHVAAARPGDTVLIPNHPFGPAMIPGFAFPGLAGVYMLYFPSDELQGRHVRFIETPATVEAMRRAGGRQAGLVVPPAAPPRVARR